jgi:hypothetical protein
METGRGGGWGSIDPTSTRPKAPLGALEHAQWRHWVRGNPGRAGTHEVAVTYVAGWARAAQRSGGTEAGAGGWEPGGGAA